jgi:hypothetical protein
MSLVNLFFVGAAKSGTTSLYKTFESQAIFATPIEKEPNYFNTGSSCVPGTGVGDRYATTVIRDQKAYQDNLKGDGDCAHLICDFSVSYLYDDEAPRNIFEYNSGARIVIMLRNPVDRAFSHYLHLKRDCRETFSFEEALAQENFRMEKGCEFSWHYFHMGLYHDQVKRYFDIFGSDKVMVYLFDDFKRDHNAFMSVFSLFVGEDSLSGLILTKDKHNATGQVKNRFLAYLINRPSFYRSLARRIFPRQLGSKLMGALRNRNLSQEKPVMNSQTRKRLMEAYVSDIVKLELLLGRDLKSWKGL